MKTSKLMFGTLLAIFLWSVHTAEAQWGTKTWRSVRGARGSWTMTYNSRTYKSFSVDVPTNAGSLRIRTGQDGRGGAGSLDLYVRYGRLPTGTSYLKRKVGPGYRKTITITNPRAGRYYIRIRGRTNYRASLQTRVFRWPSARMVFIPGGTNQGTIPHYEGESITDVFPATYNLKVNSFYMDNFEVTKALWDEVYVWALTNGYRFDYEGSGKAANHPVHSVDWWDCVKWCNARSQKEGRPAVYTVNGTVYKAGQRNNVVQTSAAGYRLPTSDEWEYAGRGGLRGKRFPWGNTISHARANYQTRSGYDSGPVWSQIPERYHPAYSNGPLPYTSPVGSFAANGYGLYDMAGNVSEWCFDLLPGYPRSLRVIRGDSWGDYSCCIGRRSGDVPYIWMEQEKIRLGFRTVRSAGP